MAKTKSADQLRSSSAAYLVSHTQIVGFLMMWLIYAYKDAALLHVLTKRQSTFHIYEWSLNDLNGDLGNQNVRISRNRSKAT